MMIGYKNSQYFYNTVLYQYGLVAAATPVGSIPAWYTYRASGSTPTADVNFDEWSLLQGDIYSTPWQSYYAIQHWNFILQGDLHRDAPANDNDDTPLGLNKAA
jgi:hypothetical protein